MPTLWEVYKMAKYFVKTPTKGTMAVYAADVYTAIEEVLRPQGIGDYGIYEVTGGEVRKGEHYVCNVPMWATQELLYTVVVTGCNGLIQKFKRKRRWFYYTPPESVVSETEDTTYSTSVYDAICNVLASYDPWAEPGVESVFIDVFDEHKLVFSRRLASKEEWDSWK